MLKHVKEGKAHSGKVLAEVDGRQVIDCSKCGFAHIYPQPSAHELGVYYKDVFYEETKPGYLEKMERELEYWHLTYQDKLDAFKQFLAGSSNTRRILDIGCSGGFFLRFFRDNGWDVAGIEPSSHAAAYAKQQGIYVEEGTVETINPASIGLFDAVHMAYVLEHVHSPERICQLTHGLLKEGGLVCIESPNDFNPLQDVLTDYHGKSSYWVAYPDHINYFTPQSLRALLGGCGFEVVDQVGTFPMELFLLMGDDYIGDDAVGRRCHEKRMSLEIAMDQGNLRDFRRELYRFMMRWGVGRGIITYGRKLAHTPEKDAS